MEEFIFKISVSKTKQAQVHLQPTHALFCSFADLDEDFAKNLSELGLRRES
jgi:hypothetical protein